MKGIVPMDFLTYGAGSGGTYADAKISLKHQSLLQDYHELKKETYSTREKVVLAKQRKRSLLAEVNFLRRRYKYLSAVKSATHLKEQEHVAQVASGSQKKLSSQIQISKEQGVRLHQLPPLPNSNHRGRVYIGKEDLNHRKIVCIGKEVALQNISPHSDFNKRRVNNASTESAMSHIAAVIDHNLGKEAQKGNKKVSNKRKLASSKKSAFSNVASIIDLNHEDRMHIVNDLALSNMAPPLLDLNQDSGLSGREPSFSTRAPIFDLNEISTAEEDMYESNSAPVEELKKGLMGAGSVDRFNHDLKLSMCRNSGEGPSPAGKQKISWQDPVALRV